MYDEMFNGLTVPGQLKVYMGNIDSFGDPWNYHIWFLILILILHCRLVLPLHSSSMNLQTHILVSELLDWTTKLRTSSYYVAF